MTDRRPTPDDVQSWIAVVVADNADDLLRYLRRRVTQPEDAADLLGRVLLALWERGARIPTSETEARMWCFGIARNVLREHHRHAAKRLALADDLRENLRGSALLDNAADITADERMRAETVRRAVAALDSRSRELIMLVHWDDFTLADAARHLSINESTARTRYGRALRRLEKRLTEHPRESRAPHARLLPDLTTGEP
jgi:RNA polymerase sigma-70 factor (ECF subfamily)